MTKQEIVRHAVGLISAYPQLSQLAGQTTFTTSAEHYYDLVVGPALEAFPYGFGFKKFSLINPAKDEDDESYLIFELPQDTGFIFYVGNHEYLPSIQALLQKRGLRKINHAFWAKLPANKLRVYFTDNYSSNYVMGYISKSPEPELFSEAFTLFVIESIAAKLALKNIQQRSIYQAHQRMATIYKHQAQKFSIDNAATFDYNFATLAKAPTTTAPSGETLPIDNQPRFIKYLKG